MHGRLAICIIAPIHVRTELLHPYRAGTGVALAARLRSGLGFVYEQTTELLC